MKGAQQIKACVALADGTLFHGYAFGAVQSSSTPICGEVVFNTSMYGYQEILTDPSYAGQIMCFTYPHIGNVGCNEQDDESSKIHVESVLIRDISKVASNFRSTIDLAAYLAKSGITGVYGIDTRELVKHLRTHGAQMGAIGSGEKIDTDSLVDVARSNGSMLGKNYVPQVTCTEPYSWEELPWSLREGGYKKISAEQLATRPHVVALDCGMKYNISRLLLGSGFRVTVVPADYSESQILKLSPDALFLSNGPGDPATLTGITSTVKNLVGRFPIFGICLGHQILAQALGGKTYKLKFGHRGGNHPVIDVTTQKVEITVQNHGFAVDGESLPKKATVSHINLNDQTVEGLHIPELKAFSVQYHPEASPGPHDAQYLFRRFYELLGG